MTALIVDDNLMFAMMIEPQLKGLGYEARTVSSSSPDALAAAAPDILLVNLSSTRFSAPDLISAVKADERLNGVAVLGYAGHVEREHAEAGRQAGADMTAPNSAMRKSLPEVLAKLAKIRAGEG